MILDYGTWNSRSTLPSPTIRRADAALADSGPVGARINLADRRTWHAGCRSGPTSGLIVALAP
jgi:hypothetical protein